MSTITSNINSLKKEIPPSVKIIAVSKTKSVSEIMEAYNTGQRDFGENRVQELLSKTGLLPSDIEWHLIGHLQTNKAKQVVPIARLIHSVDSFRLLNVINQESLKIRKVTDCLLQFHIAMEETKFGFDMMEADNMIASESFRQLQNIRICGVMGMATFTDNPDRIRKEFRQLSDWFKILKTRYLSDADYFREISMGMSGDYKIALEEGSTMVRIGSVIFGERN